MVCAIDGVNFSFGSVQVLHEVSMTFQPQAITCIVGRNGVGKTTLMRSIMGTYEKAQGSVTIGGEELIRMPAYKRAKKGLALVPQGREIFPRLSVEDNLRVGLQARTDGLKKIPENVYETFPILKDFRKRMGGDLSGGQQQQLAIARAIVGDPKVLLLDEPTEGIQPNIIQDIGHVLRQLADERGMTIILVEQYLDFVKEFGDAFYLMNRGRVVASGATDELDDNLIGRHLSV